MTGTGRRRKPSSEEEEPRSAEESATTTWSTYAPPPEPDYSYDWRRDGAPEPPVLPAQPSAATPYPDLPPPPQPSPSPSPGYPAQPAAPAQYGGLQYPQHPQHPASPEDSSPSFPSYPSVPPPSSAYPPVPPPSASQFPPAPPADPAYPASPAYPAAPPLPSYLQPPPPLPSQQPHQSQYAPAPAPPDVPNSAPAPSYTPPPAAQGFFAPQTFEQPAPYLPDEPLPGDYKPAGYQPTRYTPPDSQATTRHPSARPQPQPSVPKAPDIDVDDLFDADDLFEPEPAQNPDPIAQSSSSLSTSSLSAAAARSEAQAGLDPAERKPTKISSSKADFAFVEEETDEKEIAGWLTFVESRAESRAERARKMRNRLIAGGSALVLVVGGVLTYLWASGSPLLAGPSAPAKDVILLQVSDNTTGDAVADAILVADQPKAGASGATAAGHGAAVLIPSQMSVTGIGTGTQAFSGDMAANPPVPPAGASSVSDSLGVQVTATWSMDETTFAALIDLFGGVTVTTNASVPAVTGAAKPAPTTTPTGKSGNSPNGHATSTAPATAPATQPAQAAQPTSPAVPQGSEKLDGAQAMAYALYQGPGDSIGTQVDRFGQVLSALMSELPTQGDLVNSYLNQLGVVPDPSLPQAKLAGILADMAAEQQSGQFTVKALPLQNNATNQLDFSAAGPIISSLLGGTVQSGLASGGTARVLVEDATGTTGNEDTLLQSAAQAKLISAGYSYVGSATVKKATKSVVEIPTSSDQSAAGEVAQTLGLPTSDVQVVSGMSEISDVTVIVGTDWIQTGLVGG